MNSMSPDLCIRSRDTSPITSLVCVLEQNGKKINYFVKVHKRVNRSPLPSGGFMEKVIWIQNKNVLDLGFCDEFNSRI